VVNRAGKAPGLAQQSRQVVVRDAIATVGFDQRPVQALGAGKVALCLRSERGFYNLTFRI
jgi:hypothetical protein